MRVDIGLYAREVAGFQKPALVGEHEVAVIGGAGADRAQVLGHRVGIALEARDAHFAEAERGTAGELDLEPRLALVRIDGGAAVRDARRGVAPARELGRGLALRRIPFGLTERFATPQTPVVAHALEERLRFRVLRRRSGEAKLHRYARALAGLDGEADAPRRLRFVDAHFDLRREITFGGGDFARLLLRLLHEAVHALRRHLRIVLPALQA